MAPPGNQAVNGENKYQPAVSGETGLLNSKNRQIKKITGNRTTYERMKFNLDFNAGGIVEGTPIAEVGAELLEKVLRIGSGEPTRTKLLGHDELFCITRI